MEKLNNRMNLTDDVKQERFENIIANLFMKYHTIIEQITLDFLESIDYKIENKHTSIFDFELILQEIQAEAKKLIKHNFDDIHDAKLLQEIIDISYSQL